MSWNRIEHPNLEIWSDPNSGYSVYKGIEGWWFITPPGWPKTTMQQFGPYSCIEEAKEWANRIADRAARKEYCEAKNKQLHK